MEMKRRGALSDPTRRNMASERTYMPQLDSLRVFAVLGVMVVHNWRMVTLPWIFDALDWGHLGVRLFFVLSGFLITGILLGCRELAENSSKGRLFFIQRFYARRFLRIFPIYYGVLVIALAVKLAPAREVWPWLLTYTVNVYVFLHLNWVGHLGHFWSLAVEEQFYLLWPTAVLFAPRRWVVRILLIGIILAPLYRFYTLIAFPTDVLTGQDHVGTLTFAVLDSLGSGALLAVATRWLPVESTVWRYWRQIAVPIAVAAYLALLVMLHYHVSPTAYFVLSDLVVALIFCWLVQTAGQGFRGVVGACLEARPLVFLGKISYGLYVYHAFAPLVCLYALSRIGIPYHAGSFPSFVLSSIVTVAIAVLSWKLYEQPINNLKRYFHYATATETIGLH